MSASGIVTRGFPSPSLIVTHGLYSSDEAPATFIPVTMSHLEGTRIGSRHLEGVRIGSRHLEGNEI